MRLKNAEESNFTAAPPGRYRVKITAAETQISKKGAPMIRLTVEIREGDHAGKQAWDYLITDDSFKGAGMAKVKFRGLGIDVDKEQTDEAVAAQLLGREVYATLDVEQSKDKEGNLRWTADANTGARVPQMNNRVMAYATAGTTTTAPPPAGSVASPQGGLPFPTGGAFPGFPGAVSGGAATPPFAGVTPPKDGKKKDKAEA